MQPKIKFYPQDIHGIISLLYILSNRGTVSLTDHDRSALGRGAMYLENYLLSETLPNFCPTTS